MLRYMPLALLVAACATTSVSETDDTDDTDTCAYARPERGAAGPLQVGVARARIPAPLGIGTAGFGPFGAPSSPSPYAEIYPGTQRIHGHPEIKVVTLSRGAGHEVVFVRLDAVGVFSQLRNDIIARASARVGRDLDHAVVMGATHTHSGPGRVVNTGSAGSALFDIIADKFFPQFYDRFVEAVAGAIVASFDDLEPATAAFVTASSTDGHSDRRCEDDEVYENGTLPLIALQRDGQVDAVVMAYAMHGTVFGVDDLFLSQDVHGAVEEAVEDRFDHPVEVMLLNSWGGDMAPGNPQGAPTIDAAFLQGGFQQVREVGWALAEAVASALDDAVFVDDPEIDLQIHRLRIDREVIGYPDDIFERYPYGGVYCEGEGDCMSSERIEGLDDVCLPFPESSPAPNQTSLTVGRVGDFSVLTLPGEPTTRLVEAVLGEIQALHPDADRWFFAGYAQDYIGYALLEDDWWQGGYEASGSLWGPRQGEYLKSVAVTKFDHWASGTCPGVEPSKLEPFPYELGAPIEPMPSVDPNTVLVEVLGTYGPLDAVEFTVAGQDPWLGAPLAWVETQAGDRVLRPNGVPVDSDDYNFDIQLTVDPPYEQEAPSGREFAWRFRIPVRQPVDGGVELTPGTYVMKVEVPQPDGSTQTVSSAPFTVADPS